MNRTPNITTVQNVIDGAKMVSAGLPDGRWVPARPYGFQSWRYRLRATWLVFTGKADALIWDGQ